MKEIKIFLASSIDEFKNERNELQCFIDDMAREFRKNYDIDIEVLRCEKVDPRYVKGRSQDEFNELIKNSEMCIFLFFTKAGEYTVEEFEVARKAFEVSENGKPKIYTCFKTINDVSVEKSVTDFMSELDKNLKHFYQTFSHIDTVKLRVLLNLKMQEMDFISVEFDDGKCIVDGKETLDLSNVAEFANNGILKDLKLELEKIEKKYFELKPLYVSGQADDIACGKYADIVSKRQNLIDQITELQKSIFNISLRMCDDEVHGKMTQRQKEAYRLFELGDLEGANNILDFNEITNDYQRRKEIRKQEQLKEARIFIRESITKIEVLTAMTNYKNRFEEIEKIYDTIVPEVLEYKIEIEVLYRYTMLLDMLEEYKYKNNSKLLEIAIVTEQLLSKNKNDCDFIWLYDIYNIIIENITIKADRDKYKIKINNLFNRALIEGVPYNNLDELVYKTNCVAELMELHKFGSEKIISLYCNTLNIIINSGNENNKRCLAKIYLALGDIYYQLKDMKNAEKYYVLFNECSNSMTDEKTLEKLKLLLQNCIKCIENGTKFSDFFFTKNDKNNWLKELYVIEKLFSINKKYAKDLLETYNMLTFLMLPFGKSKLYYEKSLNFAEENNLDINNDFRKLF